MSSCLVSEKLHHHLVLGPEPSSLLSGLIFSTTPYPQRPACSGLNVCVPLNAHVGILMPSAMVLRGGAYESCPGCEGRAPMNEITALTKMTLQKKKKKMTLQSPTTLVPCSKTSGSGTVRNACLLSTNQAVCSDSFQNLKGTQTLPQISPLCDGLCRPCAVGTLRPFSLSHR